MPGFTVPHVEGEPEDRIFVSDAFKRVASALTLRAVQDGEEAVAYLSGDRRLCRRARDIQQAYALGATSYLVKSLDLKSTREMVRALGVYAGLASVGPAQPDRTPR